MALLDHVVTKLDITCQQKRGEKTSSQDEMNTLQKILGRHDLNGNVAKHICKCLSEDDVTIELLSNFDEKSLQETIESWNIKYIHQKPHIIHGLLINGIKKMKQLNVKSIHIALTEKEIIKRQQLSKLENTMIHERKQFNNTRKTRQIEKNQLQQKYKDHINCAFDNTINNIANRINIRRKELLSKLDDIFELKDKEYGKCSQYLDAILFTINQCKSEYEKNLESTSGYNNPKIQSRSIQNCRLIDSALTIGKNKAIERLKNSLNNTGYQCTVAFDNSKIINAMEKHISHFGIVQPKMGLLMEAMVVVVKMLMKDINFMHQIMIIYMSCCIKMNFMIIVMIVFLIG